MINATINVNNDSKIKVEMNLQVPNVLNAANQAAELRDEAALSERNAASSAAGALQSKNAAADSAANAVNSMEESQRAEQSAIGYADDALDSKNAAAVSERNAAISEGKAAESEVKAKQSEIAAAEFALRAANSEDIAVQKADLATEEANVATIKAALATEKADVATEKAADASASAVKAEECKTITQQDVATTHSTYLLVKGSGVKQAAVTPGGNLIITKTDDTDIDAGHVVGEPGIATGSEPPTDTDRLWMDVTDPAPALANVAISGDYNQLSVKAFADDIPITDPGNLFTANTVEEALQDLALTLKTLQNRISALESR